MRHINPSIRTLLALIAIALTAPLFAIADDGADGTKHQSWVLLPIIARTEETGMQYGAMAVYFPEKASTGTRASSIGLSARTTQKNQQIADIFADFYMPGDEWKVKPRITYEAWPANYYGIGNDTPGRPELYDSDNLEAYLYVERRAWGNYFTGAGYRYRKDTVKPLAGGRLESDGAPGAKGMEVSGLEASIGYDTRDNTFAPYMGNLMSLEAFVYRGFLGSAFDYEVGQVDLRHYTELADNNVLALAMFFRYSSTGTPLLELSSPDGAKLLRGIENGRYRDQDMVSLQTEYRFPVWWRFGATLFGEAAQVSPSPSQFTADRFKYGVGAGVRFALNPSERYNARLDVSYVDGGVGVVIYIKEAF